MPRVKTTDPTPPSAEQQIATIISKFERKDQILIQALRKFLRKRFPTANELVYDYARNFVIGYSPTAAGGQGIVAISADLPAAGRCEGVRLYLTNGANLPDPHKLLQGKAQARYLVLESASVLLRPEVEALMAAAEKAARIPLRASGRGELIIKPGPSEKRPRKKPEKR